MSLSIIDNGNVGITIQANGVDYTYNQASGEFATLVGAITLDEATYTILPNGSYSIIPSQVTLVIVGNI